MGKVTFKKQPEKFLREKENRVIAGKILTDLESLSNNWSESSKFVNVTHLKGWLPENKGWIPYRLRVGDYRVLFEKDPETDEIVLYVIKIATRGGAYQK